MEQSEWASSPPAKKKRNHGPSDVLLDNGSSQMDMSRKRTYVEAFQPDKDAKKRDFLTQLAPNRELAKAFGRHMSMEELLETMTLISMAESGTLDKLFKLCETNGDMERCAKRWKAFRYMHAVWAYMVEIEEPSRHNALLLDMITASCWTMGNFNHVIGQTTIDDDMANFIVDVLIHCPKYNVHHQSPP